MFVEGERTGKKKSAGEAERFLRTQLKSSEYVESDQIKSLFSRWKTQLRKGTLKLPEVGEDDPNDHAALEGEDDVDLQEAMEDSSEEEQEFELSVYRNVLDVVADLAEWEIDDYVVLHCDSTWYPGKIVEVNTDGSFEVKRMKHKLLVTENKFVWPQSNEQHYKPRPYKKNQLLLKLEAPEEMHSGKRYHYYKFSESEFSAASDMLRMAEDAK